jgi:hypothetical protein
VRRSIAIPAFQHAFETLGYELAGGAELEAEYERIAIYAIAATPTHATRQLASGAWSSKLGELEDISHDLHDVEGSKYGQTCIFMKRRRVSP